MATQTYTMQQPIFDQKTGVLINSQLDQGYYQQWPYQRALLDFTYSDSMMASRIMSGDIVIYPYLNGMVDTDDTDEDGFAGITLRYDVDVRSYAVTFTAAQRSRKLFEINSDINGRKRNDITRPTGGK